MEENREEVSQKLKDYIFDLNQKTPFHRHLEINITDLKPGFCEAKLVVEKKHMNLMDVGHGGVVFSILDTVGGCAARTKGYEIVTSEMNISYLNPVFEGEVLRGEGKVLKLGRNIVLVDGRLYRDKDDKLISVSRQNLVNRGKLQID